MGWDATAHWIRSKLFEIVTLFLAVVAIVFAAIQFGDSRMQLDRSDKQLAKLSTITSSIQTRYVGEFPGNLDDVRSVIKAASEGGEVDLMVDFASYAIYSRNAAYLEYISELISARQQRNVVARMLVYDKDSANAAARIQFTKSDFDVEKRQRFRGFFEHYPPAPADYDGFIARMLEFNDEAIQHLCENRIEIRRVPPSQKYLFFLWANSTPQAVFTFRNEVARTQNRELSFKSLDPSLIQVFKIIFNQTWNNVDPLHDEDVACRNARLALNDAASRP